MSIICSTSFHEHPKFIMEHYLNWDAAFQGGMTYVAHFSANTRSDMLNSAAKDNIILSAPNFVINQKSIYTKFGTSLPMHLLNYEFSKCIGINPSYLYITSPQSFAIRTGLSKYVRMFDIGIKQASFGLDKWYWEAAAKEDPRISELTKYLNIPEPFISRVDGAFIRADIFEEMIDIIMKFWSFDEIMNLNPIYPLEELVIPTIAKSLFDHNVRIADTRSKVGGGEELTPSQIHESINRGYDFSVKRIYQSRTSESRKIVLSHLPGRDILKNYNTPTEI